MEEKFDLSFLLEYLQSVAHALFQRSATKDLNAEIVVAKEALAHAQGVLQDLEAWKKKTLSTIATSSSPTIPQEDFLFAGLLL